MHPLYVLTPMTGREAADTRTIVMNGFELNWRLFIVICAGGAASVPFGILGFTLLGQTGLVLMPLVIAASVWLFYRRQTSGLRLKTYRGLWDRYGNREEGVFMLCGSAIDTSLTQSRMLRHSTITAPGHGPVRNPTALVPTSMLPPRRDGVTLGVSPDGYVTSLEGPPKPVAAIDQTMPEAQSNLAHPGWQPPPRENPASTTQAGGQMGPFAATAEDAPEIEPAAQPTSEAVIEEVQTSRELVEAEVAHAPRHRADTLPDGAAPPAPETPARSGVLVTPDPPLLFGDAPDGVDPYVFFPDAPAVPAPGQKAVR